MNKQHQIEELAVIGCVRTPQVHNAEECAKCDFKNGQCNSYRHAEALYNAGYRKTFTSELASDTQKAYKNGYKKGFNSKLTSDFVMFAQKQAVKEFAEKLKNVIHERDYVQGYAEIGLIEEIDELLKEYE